MKTPQAVYKRCIEFEERASALYMALASHFSPANPGLAALWLEMGMQEKQHAGLLQFCLAERLFAPHLPNGGQLRRISGQFRKLEKRAANKNLDIDEAFVIATEMEASEVNDLFCRLTTSVHNSMYLLRRKISSCVPDHIHALVAAAKKFGVGSETVKRIERLESGCTAA